MIFIQRLLMIGVLVAGLCGVVGAAPVVSNVVAIQHATLKTVTVGYDLANAGAVKVSEFQMGTTEVTKAQWDEVRTWAVGNGYADLVAGSGKAADHPVANINWWNAVNWCNARSEKVRLTPCYQVGGTVMRTGTQEPEVIWTANGYRLPTEAEWEKAARGGLRGLRFGWGNTVSHADANFRNNGGEVYATGTTDCHPIYNDGLAPKTSPVGTFSANGYGMRDMGGNLREWCQDCYASG